MSLKTSSFRPIRSAPKTGEPILLSLNPPLDTNDIVGWCVTRLLKVVVGWWNDYQWVGGFCEEGSADTGGNSTPFQISLNPVAWQPLPE